MHRRLAFAGCAAVLSLCLLACQDGGHNGGHATASDASLATRLQRIEDEKQIHDLMIQYGRSLDTKDFAAYAQLFAKDGEWSGLIGQFTTVKGAENIRAAMEKAFAARTYDAEHITNLHVFSNIKIDVDGDRAIAYSKWTVLSRNEKDEPYIRVNGHYDDVFIRDGSQWKFASRVARREIP
ncbi:MAG: nuclear transport factor 2 family protein [Gammaproteobacteria bacterium]